MVRRGVIVLKKLVILILLFCISYSDILAKLKSQIILSIAHLATDKNIVNIYVDDPTFLDIFENKKDIKRAKDCFKADIIITKDSKNIQKECKKKEMNIISTAYKDYKQNRDIDFGAFFWQKGRPNMLINSKIIKERNMNIPKSYYRYLD